MLLGRHIMVWPGGPGHQAGPPGAVDGPAEGVRLAYAEFSIYPFVTERLEPYVTSALIEARRSGLVVEVAPLGTIVRGDLGAVLDLLRRVQDVAFRNGATSVVTRVATAEGGPAGDAGPAGRVP